MSNENITLDEMRDVVHALKQGEILTVWFPAEETSEGANNGRD